jgi:hypothetical protein
VQRQRNLQAVEFREFGAVDDYEFRFADLHAVADIVGGKLGGRGQDDGAEFHCRQHHVP